MVPTRMKTWMPSWQRWASSPALSSLLVRQLPSWQLPHQQQQPPQQPKRLLTRMMMLGRVMSLRTAR